MFENELEAAIEAAKSAVKGILEIYNTQRTMIHNTKFDDSIEKACNNQLGLTSAIVNYGKAFLDELNNFQTFPEAQKDNLWELINRIKNTSEKIIKLEE